MSALEWIATALGILCVALGVVRSVWTFPAAIGSVLLVGVVVLRQRLYSDALLQVLFAAANIYGWRNWTRARVQTGAVAVVSLPWRERARWLLAIGVAALIWGAGMRYGTNASYPWWDAAIAAASVVAQLLMGRRAWENWVLWIAVDLGAIPLYLAKGLWVLAGLYAVYLALSAWGLRDWLRSLRRGRA